MPAPATDRSPLRLIAWWAVTLVLAGLALVLLAHFAFSIWEGQFTVSYRSSQTSKLVKRIITFANEPVEFLLRSFAGLLLAVVSGSFAVLRLRAWRDRHRDPASTRAFDAQLEDFRRPKTSKLGNAIAWILAVPFVLLALIVLLVLLD